MNEFKGRNGMSKFKIQDLTPKTIITVILFFVLFSASFVNWNPSGQVRKVAPWQDWKIPSDPDELEAYKFAHSIKLPDEPKPDDFFKEGLFGIFGRTTSDEYFKYLCETEAGEFIYRAVEGVEGIYQMRSRNEAKSREELRERYPMEDPYGYIRWEARKPHTLFANRKGYKYFETKQAPDWKELKRHGEKYLANEPVDKESKYWRYWPNSTYDKSNAENVDVLKSRYGFTWRGIRRPYDRENGIAGGELIVMDLETNEVLGVRRGFARTGRVPNNVTGINWEVTQVCPKLSLRGNRSKDVDFTFWFINKILVPIKSLGSTSGSGLGS